MTGKFLQMHGVNLAWWVHLRFFEDNVLDVKRKCRSLTHAPITICLSADDCMAAVNASKMGVRNDSH